MYARFVNHLEYIIREGLSTALVADIAQRQLADIFGLVTDDVTAAGLSELTAANPAAASAMTARMDIADTMLFYTSWLEQRVRASCHALQLRPRALIPLAPFACSARI